MKFIPVLTTCLKFSDKNNNNEASSTFIESNCRKFLY